MRVYIWNNPYHVNYGGSFLWVVAETEEAARELTQKAMTSQFGLEPTAKMQRPDKPLGPPDRIEELPHAECYQWEE